MRLTVLGCSGSGPGPASPASGYLVEAGAVALVLDLGNGTFGALQRHLDPWRLDAVAFSHLHPDHCADFSALVVHRRYHPFAPAGAGRLAVHAPEQAPDRFAAAYAPDAAERAATDLSDTFAFHPHVPTVAVGDVVLRTAAVDHPCEAYALRVEHGGRSLVYSGDTGPCDGLPRLARGADVLLCEATWPHVTAEWDEPPPGVHLSGRQAGEYAREAGVGRLLLTHVAPWFDGEALRAEAAAVYEGRVEQVVAGGTYEI
ncbi:MBL fold metallo-hydrolase [Pseudonocardia sp.]|uniref:MBL fold metallo-hydrolase n=1 Tax=Pseudonocardia sp. TaxID=60912 RepID=UPI00262B997F|nr:MBL fold metallo-hydrolase [Pseudonocardia sp.]